MNNSTFWKTTTMFGNEEASYQKKKIQARITESVLSLMLFMFFAHHKLMFSVMWHKVMLEAE